jgi:hypothetical protein
MDATNFAASFKPGVTDVFNDAAPRYDRGVKFFTPPWGRAWSSWW